MLRSNTQQQQQPQPPQFTGLRSLPRGTSNENQVHEFRLLMQTVRL
jgi:hypothetical protein